MQQTFPPIGVKCVSVETAKVSKRNDTVGKPKRVFHSSQDFQARAYTSCPDVGKRQCHRSSANLPADSLTAPCSSRWCQRIKRKSTCRQALLARQCHSFNLASSPCREIFVIHDPAPMIAETLAISAFGANAVHFPAFAQLASGALITGAASFVVHGRPPQPHAAIESRTPSACVTFMSVSSVGFPPSLSAL